MREPTRAEADRVEDHDECQRSFAMAEKMGAGVKFLRREFCPTERTRIIAKPRVIDAYECRSFGNLSALVTYLVEQIHFSTLPRTLTGIS